MIPGSVKLFEFLCGLGEKIKYIKNIVVGFYLEFQPFQVEIICKGCAIGGFCCLPCLISVNNIIRKAGKMSTQIEIMVSRCDRAT